VAIAIASENSTLEPQERLQLLFATSLPETPTLEKGLTAVEGAVLVSPCLAEESDYMQQARIRWGQQEINWRVATSYDATQALIEAIRLSEVPTREEILNNLEGLNLSVEQTSGFGLKWSESDYHSNAQRPYCIAQIRNRRFEEIF
jgi:ABC-type branched-subunit amino acid transport system substrate-binding protein